jgi:hypothetical protein
MTMAAEADELVLPTCPTCAPARACAWCSITLALRCRSSLAAHNEGPERFERRSFWKVPRPDLAQRCRRSFGRAYTEADIRRTGIDNAVRAADHVRS